MLRFAPPRRLLCAKSECLASRSTPCCPRSAKKLNFSQNNFLFVWGLSITPWKTSGSVHYRVMQTLFRCNTLSWPIRSIFLWTIFSWNTPPIPNFIPIGQSSHIKSLKDYRRRDTIGSTFCPSCFFVKDYPHTKFHSNRSINKQFPYNMLKIQVFKFRKNKFVCLDPQTDNTLVK